MHNIAILLSGNGSNLKAIIDKGINVSFVAYNNPDALGLKVNFVKGKGPIFEKSLSSMDKLDLNTNEFHDKIQYVYSATSLIKENVNVPLIGFTGSPWTLFVYMFQTQINVKLFLKIL